MRTFKLTIAYDGTNYAGWQRQVAAETVQSRLEAALAEIEGRAVTVQGAGRTDAGVHALGQVASFRLHHSIDEPALWRALNAKLPDDVRVTRVEPAADDFHARYHAVRKSYRYRIDTADVADPFERRFAWHVPRPIDHERMRNAAAMLVGRHDFAAFQTAATDGRLGSTIRTIAELRVDRAPREILTVEVVGDGFLRYMVRTIVGTLVEVGHGRRRPGDIADVLASRTREQAGPTAPAHGLFLVSVDYPDA